MVQVNKKKSCLSLATLGLLGGREDEDSVFFNENSRNRIFWNSKPAVISCRIRQKSAFNTAAEFASNIRAFLLDDPVAKVLFIETSNKLAKADKDILEQFKGDFTDKKAVMTALGLFMTHSCKLVGYEVEFFYLKCFIECEKPYWVARVCYHCKYEAPEWSKEPIPFNDLIEKIRWG